MGRREGTEGLTRRAFMREALAAGGVIAVAGPIGVRSLVALSGAKPKGYVAVAVDFERCAGCRTCEAVCSAANHGVRVGGKVLRGLGNPALANIRVHHFNPDVDVPRTCALCADNPCVAACPIPPDSATGRRALFRDERTGAIRNDEGRCIGCGSCARACRQRRAGVIVPHPKTGKPERMCTLCGGDPQCVAHCPYGALSVVRVGPDRAFLGKPAGEVARILAERWYGAGKGGE